MRGYKTKDNMMQDASYCQNKKKHVIRYKKVLKTLFMLLLIVCGGYVYWYYSQPVYYIYPEISKIDCDADGGEIVVKIKTDAPYNCWDVDAPSWIDVSRGEDFIKIKYDANKDDCEYKEYKREGTIKLTCMDRKHTYEEIEVRQPETEKYPRASIGKKWITKNKEGVTIHVNVKTRYMANEEGCCVVFFENEEGITLTSEIDDSVYLNSDKQIVTLEDFMPEESKQTIYDISLFVPYYMFSVKDAGKIIYDVNVRRKIDGEWKTFTHDSDSFDLTKHEITSGKYGAPE